MKHFIALAILCCFAGLIAVQAFDFKPNKLYYDNFFPNLTLQCGDDAWNGKTAYSFFGNGVLIYNSSSKDNFPYVESTRYNKTITLNSRAGKNGWTNMHCQINQTKSSNSMTLPYTSTLTLLYSPTNFQPKQNYTLQCDGYLAPKPSSQTVEFLFNQKVFASIFNTKLTVTTGNAAGLKVYQGLNKDNSIIVTPTLSSNNGTYSCQLRFTLQQNALNTVVSNSWKTKK